MEADLPSTINKNQSYQFRDEFVHEYNVAIHFLISITATTDRVLFH